MTTYGIWARHSDAFIYERTDIREAPNAKKALETYLDDFVAEHPGINLARDYIVIPERNLNRFPAPTLETKLVFGKEKA